MSHDPRIDPAPGDVLCDEHCFSHVVVDAVTTSRVSYRLRVDGLPDQCHDVTPEKWRRLATSSQVVPLSARLALAEKERLALVEQLATLERRIAWLRGEP